MISGPPARPGPKAPGRPDPTTAQGQRRPERSLLGAPVPIRANQAEQRPEWMS